MSVQEFRHKLLLIKDFAFKLNSETIPYNDRKVIIKVYALSLKLNLSDYMLLDIIKAS